MVYARHAPGGGLRCLWVAGGNSRWLYLTSAYLLRKLQPWQVGPTINVATFPRYLIWPFCTCIPTVYILRLLLMKSYSVIAKIRYAGFLPEAVNVFDNGNIVGVVGAERVDVKSWKVPPHIALANMELTQESLAAFTRKYGALGDVNFPYRDTTPDVRFTLVETLTQGLDTSVRDEFTLIVPVAAHAQNALRLAWRGERTVQATILEPAVSNGGFQLFAPNKTTYTELRTLRLWSFISLAFLVDYSEGRAKICGNPECATPYFIQKRKDQQACSHRCAVEINNQRRSKARVK
jgi:hypothetical protein